MQPPGSVYGYGPPGNEPSGITNPSFGSTVYSNVGQSSSRPPYNDPSVPPSDLQARMRPGVGQVTPPMGPPPGIFNPAAAVPEPMPPPPPMSRNEPPGATPVWNDPPLVRSKQVLSKLLPFLPSSFPSSFFLRSSFDPSLLPLYFLSFFSLPSLISPSLPFPSFLSHSLHFLIHPVHTPHELIFTSPLMHSPPVVLLHPRLQ